MAVRPVSAPERAPAHRYRVIPGGKFYFLYGENQVGMEQFKNDIVDANLQGYERDENYVEIIPATAAGGLARIMGDLTNELSTFSLLPGVKRVVTLYTCNDFFSAGDAGGRKPRASAKSKTPAAAGREAAPSPSAHLARFIETELLPKLDAVLIIYVLEDGEKFRKVSTANPVMKLAANQSVAYEFKEPALQFLFLDALLARRLPEALSLWRKWYEQTGGAPKMYWALVSNVRLLIQAKVAATGLRSRGITPDKFASEFLPAEARNNVMKLAPFRRQKLDAAAGKFTLVELLGCYERLSELMKYAIPMSTDVYVPDRALLAEYWIIEFCAGRQDSQR